MAYRNNKALSDKKLEEIFNDPEFWKDLHDSKIFYKSNVLCEHCSCTDSDWEPGKDMEDSFEQGLPDEQFELDVENSSDDDSMEKMEQKEEHARRKSSSSQTKHLSGCLQAWWGTLGGGGVVIKMEIPCRLISSFESVCVKYNHNDLRRLPAESILKILKSGVLNPEGVIAACESIERIIKAGRELYPVMVLLSKKCGVRISEVSRPHGSNDAPSDAPHGSNDAPSDAPHGSNDAPLDAFEKASKVINNKPSTSKNQSIPSNAVAHFTGCSEARKNGSTDGVNENDQVAAGLEGGSNSEFKHLIVLSRSVREIKKFNTISQNIEFKFNAAECGENPLEWLEVIYLQIL
ncbi:hypothetical protein FQR65_LT18506 [Abscondita terminalis]|nr:hypothetical protein FQR65_LT18506 [Abscondita terminalis]